MFRASIPLFLWRFYMLSYVYAVFGAFAIPVLLWTFSVVVVRIIEKDER